MSMLLATSALSAPFTTVTVTNGTDTNGGTLTYQGFAISGSQADGVAGIDAFGSRTPTTFRGYTLEGAYEIGDSGSPGTYTYKIEITGNQTGVTPFSKIEFYEGGSLTVTHTRAAASTPAGVYDAAADTTVWTWTSAFQSFDGATTVLRVFQ